MPARLCLAFHSNSRNKILAINVVLDPPNCLLLLSYAVLTVTNICFSIPVARTPLIRNSACSLFGWERYL